MIQVSALYFGHSGVHSWLCLRECPDFDHWQFLAAGDLRRMLGDVLVKLVERCAAAGDYATALDYARRWLSFDPLSAPAHRALIQSYSKAGFTLPQRGSMKPAYR